MSVDTVDGRGLMEAGTNSPPEGNAMNDIERSLKDRLDENDRQFIARNKDTIAHVWAETKQEYLVFQVDYA